MLSESSGRFSPAKEQPKFPKDFEDSMHWDVACDACNTFLGMEPRFMCMDCQIFDLCSACKKSGADKKHALGNHVFAEIRDSGVWDPAVYGGRCKKCPQALPCACFIQARASDPYAFAKTDPSLDGDPQALALVLEMLERENALRLEPGAYEGVEERDRGAVTDGLQRTVAAEFLDQWHQYFSTVDEGVLFLRAAVGNFPSHLDALRGAAQYVDFTQHCRRGSLYPGRYLMYEETMNIGLVCARTEKKMCLGDLVDRADRAGHPLVLVASSGS